MPPSRAQRPQRRPGARPINKSKWKECRSRLRNYRAAVQLDVEPVPTSLESSEPFHGTSHSDRALSAASKTTSRDRSESSFGTPYTNYTAVFSVINGSPQHEPEKRGLDAVPRARKALTRYLKACEDCRSRKVKCYLSHHSLEDILDGQHTTEDVENVKWAINHDCDPAQTPSNIETEVIHEEQLELDQPATDESVIDRVNRALDVPTAPVMSLYPQSIDDPDFDLFEEQSQEPDGAPSLDLHPDYIDFAMSVTLPPYSTTKTERMFLLGARLKTSELSVNYDCCYEPCSACYLVPDDLVAHYATEHFDFVHQPDPLRLFCPACNSFYADAASSCPEQDCTTQMALLEGIFGEFLVHVGDSAHRSGKDGVSVPDSREIQNDLPTKNLYGNDRDTELNGFNQTNYGADTRHSTYR